MSIEQRTILVTGASGAIGSEIVRHLCASRTSSTRIVAHWFQNAANAQFLQKETSCELLQCDLGDETQVAALFDGLDELFAVVHCAGIARDALLLKASRQSWDETLDVNCDATFLVVRESLRRLNFGGRLVVLASRVGEIGAVGQSAYAASKAAQIALVKCAALESVEQRIGVNAVCPPVIDSSLTRKLSQSRRDALQRQSVWGEFGSAKTVAATVDWLLSEAGAEISGQTIHCDSRIY